MNVPPDISSLGIGMLANCEGLEAHLPLRVQSSGAIGSVKDPSSDSLYRYAVELGLFVGSGQPIGC